MSHIRPARPAPSPAASLVTVGKTGRNYVFVVPVNKELDLKKAAKAVGEKSIEMIKAKELLPLGAKVMTFECGMRFLTDYLQGDTYFKIHRENHNLDRCRTQFKLVSDMEAKWDTMNAIIQKYKKTH